MHSRRMSTAHLLPVSPSMHCSGGGYLPGGCTCQGVSLVGGVYLPGGYLPRGMGRCTCLEGVPAQKGVPALLGCTCLGGVPAWGCTCPGVYLPGGCVPARGCPLLGECTCPGGTCPGGWGVYLPGGTCPGGYLPRYCPPCEQND